MISTENLANIAALFSLSGFLAGWCFRNYEILRNRFSCKTWLLIGGLWALVVILRNVVLPLDSYQIIAHDQDPLSQLITSPMPSGNIVAVSRLYLMFLFLVERLKGWGKITEALLLYPASLIRWPSVYDLLMGPFIVAFVVIGSRLNIRAAFSLAAILLVLLHPASLFFSSVLLDHWAAGFILIVAAFHIIFEFQRIPFTSMSAVIVLGPTLAAVFYFKYFSFLLLPIILLGIVFLKESLRIKGILVVGIALVFCALSVFELAGAWPLVESAFNPSGRFAISPFYKNYSIFRIPSYLSMGTLYRFIYPFGTLPFLILLVVGLYRLIFDEKGHFDWKLFVPFLFVCLLFPYGGMHPGDRLFLPFVFVCVPLLAKGIQEFANETLRETIHLTFPSITGESDSRGSFGVLVADKFRKFSVSMGGWRLKILGLAVFSAVLLWSVLGVRQISKNMFMRLPSEEFDDLAAHLDPVNRDQFAAIVSEHGRNRPAVHIIGDVPIETLLDVGKLDVGVLVHTLPFPLSDKGIRQGPSFLLLEKDAFQWTARFRKDYKTMIESKYHLEPIGLHSVSRSVIFLLRRRTGIES